MMKKLLNFVVICLLSQPFLHSQDNKSREHRQLLNDANEKYEIGDYYNALKAYDVIFLKDSLDELLNFKMGVCSYKMKFYKKAAAHFNKASSKISPEIFYYKALLAHMDKKFKKAINYYNAYKLIRADKDFDNQEINRLIDKSTYAEKSMEKPLNVGIDNMGTTINTTYDEYVPLISADGTMLFFTARKPGSTGGLLNANDQYFEDIYVSHSVDNIWATPKQLRKGINTATNDACAGLSADGQGLYIFKTSDDLISGDLYECRMGLEDWEDPFKLGSDINSDFIEASASITVDDKVLYFSSDREGGYGGKDIYRVVRLPNGNWSKASNLGPIVNTPQDEDAPFIHADGKTLYFSSRGHKNMGGYDVFKTELEYEKWSIPVNLGYPVNTVLDDIFFVIEADGKTGYYSSSREGGYGGQDIYKVTLKDESTKLHVLKGKVASNEEGLPIGATITLIENESKQVQGIYKGKETTGRFIMLVKPNKTYNVIVEADNYYSFTSSLEFDLTKKDVIQFKLDKKSKSKDDE